MGVNRGKEMRGGCREKNRGVQRGKKRKEEGEKKKKKKNGGKKRCISEQRA